jgi:hypothetical protein
MKFAFTTHDNTPTLQTFLFVDVTNAPQMLEFLKNNTSGQHEFAVIEPTMVLAI